MASEFGVALAQLLLQDLQLFAQYVILLQARQALAHLFLQLLLDPDDFQFPGEDRIQVLQPLQGTQFLQDLLLILIADAGILGDIVGKIAGGPGWRAPSSAHRRTCGAWPRDIR